MSTPLEATLSLEVAAAPTAPSIARRFAAETLRSLGQSEEAVDDMRLAVSEVISALVEEGLPGPFQLTIEVTGPRLILPSLPAMAGDEIVDRRRVLEALAHVRTEHLDGSTVLSVVAR